MNKSKKSRMGLVPHARALQRVALSILLAGALAACATGPKNPLTAEQIDEIDIQVVNVTVSPEAQIAWGDGEQAYAATKGCEKPETNTAGSGDQYNVSSVGKKPEGCDYDALVSSPEALEFMRQRVIDMMETALSEKVQPAFQGTKAASLDVTVLEVRIISGGQAVLVGGNHVLRATLDVVDKQTGTPIVSNPEMFSMAGYGPGGLLSLVVEATSSDPVLRLSKGYAEGAHNWLSAENQ